MVERLLVQLTQTVHDASWLLIFYICVRGVLLALLVITTLATIFDDKRPPDPASRCSIS